MVEVRIPRKLPAASFQINALRVDVRRARRYKVGTGDDPRRVHYTFLARNFLSHRFTRADATDPPRLF